MRKDNEIAVVITEKGYANRLQLKLLPQRKPNGTGQYIIRVKKGDAVAAAVLVEHEDKIMLINADGRTVIVRAASIPELDWQKQGMSVMVHTDKGDKPLPIPEAERSFITSIAVPKQWEEEALFLVFASKGGYIVKKPWRDFHDLINGVVEQTQINFTDSKENLTAAFTIDTRLDHNQFALLLTSKGRVNCVNVGIAIAPMKEVLGISMETGESCVYAIAYRNQDGIATVTTNGAGKVSRIDGLHIKDPSKMERWHTIGGEGMLAHIQTDVKGTLVACCPVNINRSDIILITSLGKAIRLPVDDKEIRIHGLKSSGLFMQKTNVGPAFSKSSSTVKCLLCSEYEEE